MKICSNCGGSFNENEAKCPYCGALNAEGAEKEYMGKLEKVRKDLDNVDEEAVVAYKKEVKTFFSVFLITVFIAGIIAACIFGKAKSTLDTMMSYDRTPIDRKIEKMASFHQVTQQWNQIYDNGDYEEFYEVVNRESKSYSDMIFYWKHYRFYLIYGDIFEAKTSYDEFCAKETPGEYEYTNLLQDVYFSYYQLNYSADADLLSKEEKAILDEKMDNIIEDVKETLEMTDTEFEGLRLSSGGSKYPSFVEITNYVKERWFK